MLRRLIAQDASVQHYSLSPQPPTITGRNYFFSAANAAKGLALLNSSSVAVKSRSTASLPGASATTGTANTKWLAETLYTKFLLPFELAAVILTVAVIAAVMLTLRRRTGIKTQNPAQQSAVRAEDRLRMVKMEAVKPQPIVNDTEEAR